MFSSRPRSGLAWLARGLLAWASILPATTCQAAPANVTFTIKAQSEDAPMPCRIHLRDAAGKAVKPEGYPSWNDHFVCPGTADPALAAGQYDYTIERGPEFEAVSGQLTVPAGEPARLAVTLPRLANL